MLDKTKIDALIEREGGAKFTDHPADRGGPTRWGVTEQVARAFGYSGAMQDLPRNVAEAIYTARYWTEPGLARVDAVSAAVASKLFDIGVNMGPAAGARFLQRALNVLNRGATDWPDITADGVIGPMTLQALAEYQRIRGLAGIAELLSMLEAQQRVRYMEIAERDPRQEVFQYGWQARAGAEV